LLGDLPSGARGDRDADENESEPSDYNLTQIRVSDQLTVTTLRGLAARSAVRSEVVQ